MSEVNNKVLPLMRQVLIMSEVNNKVLPLMRQVLISI